MSTCKRPHCKILVPRCFPTFLKWSSACQLGKTELQNIKQFSTDMVFEIWLSFPIIWYFDMESFSKHYLEHCRIKFKEFQNMTFAWTFQDTGRTIWHFWIFLRPVLYSHDKIWPCWGHLNLTLGHRGSQWIHGVFLLRLSVFDSGEGQSGPFVNVW